MNALFRIPYVAAAEAAALAGGLVPARGSKLARSLVGRRRSAHRMAQWASAERRDTSRPLIWMHAPSVGEGLMAKPVIERIRAARPDIQLAFTFFSPSAEQLARTLPVDVADYLPFDTPRAATVLLDALRPAALVFSKLDVWPLLVAEAHRRSVPVALISAAVRRDSRRNTWLARLILRDTYASLAAVGAASGDDAARLADLGARHDVLSVTGDTRYDQVWARVHNPPDDADARVSPWRSNRPTVVAGSTWPADDAVLQAAWPGIREAVGNARLVVAAHEPNAAHRDRLRSWAATQGLTATTIDNPSDADVVVVDRVGWLVDLYRLATVAFVGGGFHGAGLHSVVEPAAHGTPVLFGPRGAGTRDAALLIDGGGGFVVRDAAAATARIVRLMRNAEERASAGASGRGVIAAHLGAADRSTSLVLSLLRPGYKLAAGIAAATSASRAP